MAAMPNQALEKAAEFFHEACGLYEDDDLNPRDSLAVIQRAFLTSDCDDFAWMLARITGWLPLRASWEIPGGGCGHHTVVQDPDGRLIDVTGVTDLSRIQRQFGNRDQLDISLRPAPDHEPTFDSDPKEGGDFEQARLLVKMIANLPYPPFSEERVHTVALMMLAQYEKAIAAQDEAELPPTP